MTISKVQIWAIFGAIAVLITLFSFMTDIKSVPDIIQHINKYVNHEPKSNLEVSVITEPPVKLPKASSFIYEFNICNNGKTGEEYNYSLEINNINIDGEIEKRGMGLLNDGETCEKIEYILYPDSQYSSKIYYHDIDFSIKVYSESLNKLLFDKTYKYSLDEESSLYELK